MTRDTERGQILLITLLVLSIGATVVLSLIGRTTTDIDISKQIEESAQALSAAEAGIEEALTTGLGTTQSQTIEPGVNYDVTVATTGGAAGVYTIPNKTAEGDVGTIWLAEHNADGSLDTATSFAGSSVDVCWSQESTTPAAVISIFYEDSGGTTFVARTAHDPDTATRNPANNFSSVTATSNGCGVATMYQQTVTFADFGINPAVDSLLSIRVRPVYSDAQFAVDTGTDSLATQGNMIESTGTTDSGISRKVIVFQEFRSPPSIFDAVVFSQASFAH